MDFCETLSLRFMNTIVIDVFCEQRSYRVLSREADLVLLRPCSVVVRTSALSEMTTKHDVNSSDEKLFNYNGTVLGLPREVTRLHVHM